MSIVAIDIGSRRIGLVDGSLVDGSPKIHAADVLEVGPDLRATIFVDLLEWLRTGDKPEAVVLEHAHAPYMPPGATPQQAQALASSYATGSVLVAHVVALCAERGIPVLPYVDAKGVTHSSIPRQAWAHRILPGTSGGISQSAAREAVGAYLSDEDLERLVGDDRLDAAGALLWALLPPVDRKHTRSRDRRSEPRPVLTPAQRLERKRAGMRLARGQVPALSTAGRAEPCCGRCGGPRRGHVRGQPCPPLERPAAPLETRGGPPACRRCGGPRKGHLRGLPCPPLPATPPPVP